jgi:DNA mismatch endonuclease (patch repair protein)
MADNHTKEARSRNMSHIRSKDTKPEEQVRKYLFANGFRYRKNVGSLPGKPDIVLPKYHTVIFVHGCFWHRHTGCKDATVPKTRTEFWIDKFEKNVANDRIHREMLEAAGWNVITLWECDIKKRFDVTMENVVRELNDHVGK